MSTTLENAREAAWHAVMSWASYFQLTSGMSQSQLEQVLTSTSDGFPQSLASEFARRYLVYYADTGHGDDGYQGVIFSEVDANRHATGHFIVANRGTEGAEWSDSEAIRDLGTDGILALFGASDQDGSAQALFRHLPASAETVTVTGHSLGGYLTSMLAMNYPEAVDGIYTYNGAGFGAHTPQVQAAIFTINEALNLLGLSPQSFPFKNSWNYVTDENPEVVPMLGFHLGQVVRVSTDLSGPVGSVLGHGIDNLTDAMVVNYLFKALDSDLEIEKINNFIERMQVDPSLDRNATVAYLGMIFGRDVSKYWVPISNQIVLR